MCHTEQHHLLRFQNRLLLIVIVHHLFSQMILLHRIHILQYVNKNHPILLPPQANQECDEGSDTISQLALSLFMKLSNATIFISSDQATHAETAQSNKFKIILGFVSTEHDNFLMLLKMLLKLVAMLAFFAMIPY